MAIPNRNRKLIQGNQQVTINGQPRTEDRMRYGDSRFTGCGVKQVIDMNNQTPLMEDNNFEVTAWVIAGMVGFLSGNITGFLLGALFAP